MTTQTTKPAKPSRRNELLAGIIVLSAMALFTITTILAGNFRKLLEKRQTIHVSFASARGLVVNNPVQVSGVEVGLVKEIELTRLKNPESGMETPRVLVRAEIPAKIWLSKDSQAEVNVSLTGITVLRINRGSSTEQLGREDIIPGIDPVDVGELSLTLGRIAQRVDAFVQDLTSDQVLGDIRTVVQNTRETTEALKIVSSSLTELIGKNQERWQKMISNAERISVNLDGLLNDNRKNLTTTIAELPTLTREVRALSQDGRQLLAKNESNLTRMIADLQVTSANLKETSASVKRQPWILLKNPDKSDVRSRDLYTAARDLQGAVGEMRNTAETLKALEAMRSGSKGSQRGDVDRLLVELNESYQRLSDLQQKIEEAARRSN